jgi:hypothetical protein
MPLLNLAEFGDESGHGTLSLDYNTSNGRATRLVVDNRTASAFFGSVMRASDGQTQQQVFQPNAAGAPTQVTIPQGWVSITVLASGEIVTTPAIETRTAFPG